MLSRSSNGMLTIARAGRALHGASRRRGCRGYRASGVRRHAAGRRSSCVIVGRVHGRRAVAQVCAGRQLAAKCGSAAAQRRAASRSGATATRSASTGCAPGDEWRRGVCAGREQCEHSSKSAGANGVVASDVVLQGGEADAAPGAAAEEKLERAAAAALAAALEAAPDDRRDAARARARPRRRRRLRRGTTRWHYESATRARCPTRSPPPRWRRRRRSRRRTSPRTIAPGWTPPPTRGRARDDRVAHQVHDDHDCGIGRRGASSATSSSPRSCAPLRRPGVGARRAPRARRRRSAKARRGAKWGAHRLGAADGAPPSGVAVGDIFAGAVAGQRGSPRLRRRRQRCKSFVVVCPGANLCEANQAGRAERARTARLRDVRAPTTRRRCASGGRGGWRRRGGGDEGGGDGRARRRRRRRRLAAQNG